MLAGLVGSVVVGTLFVVVLLNGVFSLALLTFLFVCLFTFVTGLTGWRRGENALRVIEENVGGPF
jgi:hypothetical protein